MLGIKKFTNNSCVNLEVCITVRAGKIPGCIYRTEQFCLKCFECQQICYGDDLNPFLDGIRACSHEFGQCAEISVCVDKCGCPLDKLINTHNHIIFLSAGPAIAISGGHCKLDP